MPLDAISLRAVVEELRPQLLNLRIDKVQQPARDQVILLLRSNKRLLLNAGANAPRLQLTELLRDNPAEPPMFCMLLRKHLVGARVAEITQPGLERLVRIELDVTDDFGQPGHRTLVLEAMGRRSNLILLDGENRVIDCMRRVDAEMSAARQVLPGLFYEPPASTGRLPFLEETEEGLAEKLAQVNPEIQLDRFLLDAYFGISPLMARELSFRACGETDGRLCNLDEAGRSRFQDAFFAFANCVKENQFTPIVLKREGVPFEFSSLPVHQYGLAAETETFESFSALLDSFYEAKERQERVRQRGADLIRTATTARDRVRRKLALQEKDYASTQERDALRLSGDLITANLYRMERGQSKLVCQNYYDEDLAEVTIPLDPLLTPQQNAAKYYKRYTKAKTAEKHLREQIDKAIGERDYLESVQGEIALAQTEAEFAELCDWLREHRLERVGAFAFSPEEGTRAARMDHVDAEEALRRAELVVDVQSDIIDGYNASLLGTEREVLCEGFDSQAQMHFGRSYAESPDIDGRIWFDADREVEPGTFVTVRLTGVMDGELTGELAEE